MNPTKSIRIEGPGTYTFSHTREINALINDELLVTVFNTTKQTLGVLVHAPTDHLSDLLAQLASLVSKMGPTNTLEAKVFGLSRGPEVRVSAVLGWLRDHSINLVASDTGRGLPRAITMKSDTGMVGLRYQRNESLSDSGLLSTGSARMRNPLETIHSEVLVLSSNPVWRTLAKQAIEEQKNWGAHAPTRPSDILASRMPEPFPWSVVLLFSDLEADVPTFLEKVWKKYPAVQIRWVGAELPSFSSKYPNLKLIPPLDPILLPEFKRRIKSAVFEHEVFDTSDLINFPKRKKRR